MRAITLGLILLIIGCTPQETESNLTNELTAPKAEKKDSALTVHGDTRVDPYFWMRLSDEQKNAAEPDNQTKKVLDYLTAENDFTKSKMSDTEDLQDKLYQEMTGRLKKDDESVPYFKNGYWYYSKYEEGKEYAIYCRKKGSLESNEEIILDTNIEAEKYDYYGVRGLTIKY